MPIDPSLTGSLSDPFVPDEPISSPGVTLPPPAAPTPPGIGGGGSSIELSDKEAMEMAIEAGIPYLMLPQFAATNFSQFFMNSNNGVSGVSGVDPGVWLMKTENDLQKIASSVLDAWSKNLKEERDRIADWLKSPAYFAHLALVDPSTIAKDEGKKALTPIEPSIFAKYINSLPETERAPVQTMYSHYQALGLQSTNLAALRTSFDDLALGNMSIDKAADYNVLAAAMIISSTGTFQAVALPGTISTNTMAINPIFDSATGPVRPAPLADPGLYNVINFFAVPLMAYSVAETIGLAKNADKKPSPEDVAKQFAAKVVALITSSDAFNVILNQIIVQRSNEGVPLTPKEREQLAVEVKITFLAMALAILYKSTLGDAAWITAKEFASILDGSKVPKKGSIEESMRDFIIGKEGLPGLLSELDVDVRAAFLEKLFAYMDTNPSVDKMLDPYGRVFDVMFADTITPEPGRA